MDGKTILRHIIYGGYLCVFFTDGTHQIIQGKTRWECDEIELVDDADVSEYDLHTLGVISNEQYEEIQKQKREKDRLHRENVERQQYAALKKKFETTESDIGTGDA